RDFHVTGVQTCALPISLQFQLKLDARFGCRQPRAARAGLFGEVLPEAGEFLDITLVVSRPLIQGYEEGQLVDRGKQVRGSTGTRSEERRVGKEGGCRGW